MNRIDTLIEMSAKVLQLWEWVGERIDRCNEELQHTKGEPARARIFGLESTLAIVRLHMRTLFAGLIEFDGEGEEQDEGF